MKIRTETTDSGFRESTPREDLILSIIDGMKEYILNDYDCSFLVETNDLDIVQALCNMANFSKYCMDIRRL